MTNKTTSTLADTHDATIRAILTMVLEKAPLGIPSREVVYLDTERKAATPSDLTFYIPFHRAAISGQECSLPLEANLSVGLHNDGTVEDADGNIWSKRAIVVRVAGPCWGACDPLLALQRLGLMQEVAIFANALAAAFNEPVYQLKYTKAELAERGAKIRRAAQEKIVHAMITVGCKGLRVGANRALGAPNTPAAPGLYSIAANDRAYDVLVFADGSADARRLS